MKIITIIIYYGLIMPISALPMRVLYMLSDILFGIIYLTGYRKDVVKINIDRSFPEKSEKEKKDIVKYFYRHLCDLIVESLKCFSIRREDALRRMKMDNLDEILDSYKKGKSIILAGGHYNNWEMFAVAIQHYIPFKTIAIYSPLKNKFIDRKMQNSRSRFGLTLIPMKQIGTYLSHHKDKQTATIFAFDQSPSNPHNAYWMTFLNQETGVQLGVEKYANKFDMPVYYGCINKEKRGYYNCHFIKITDDPSMMEDGQLTSEINKQLESDIRKNPPYWLWSHKRWKRQKPENYVLRSLKTKDKS